MDNFSSLVDLLDYTLDSKRKRHLVGGILLSVSFLFGGLAITAITVAVDEKKEEEKE